MNNINTNTSLKTRRLTTIALLSAIAAALMYVEMPLPFFPPFLKLDGSNIAVMVGAFLMGPLAAIPIAFTKALFHMLQTQTGGVGEIADFICAIALAVPAGWYYAKQRNKKSAIIGCAIGIVCATIVGAFANLYLLIPFFSGIMPMDAIWEVCSKINPVIVDLNSYILYGAIPFNLFKTVVISVVTILIYKTISKLAHLR